MSCWTIVEHVYGVITLILNSSFHKLFNCTTFHPSPVIITYVHIHTYTGYKKALSHALCTIKTYLPTYIRMYVGKYTCTRSQMKLVIKDDVRTYVHMHKFIRRYIYYTHVYVCAYVRMYTHMYACMYIHNTQYTYYVHTYSMYVSVQHLRIVKDNVLFHNSI